LREQRLEAASRLQCLQFGQMFLGRGESRRPLPVRSRFGRHHLRLVNLRGGTDHEYATIYRRGLTLRIYAKTAEEFARDFSLSGVEVLPSHLSGTRKIVDCIFSYTNRNTDFTEKFFVRVDVTEEFPFLVTKLSPYYDR
jgi:hypothetical protein